MEALVAKGKYQSFIDMARSPLGRPSESRVCGRDARNNLYSLVNLLRQLGMVETANKMNEILDSNDTDDAATEEELIEKISKTPSGWRGKKIMTGWK